MATKPTKSLLKYLFLVNFFVFNFQLVKKKKIIRSSKAVNDIYFATGLREFPDFLQSQIFHDVNRYNLSIFNFIHIYTNTIDCSSLNPYHIYC